jgi:hypothetical protein
MACPARLATPRRHYKLLMLINMAVSLDKNPVNPPRYIAMTIDYFGVNNKKISCLSFLVAQGRIGEI